MEIQKRPKLARMLSKTLSLVTGRPVVPPPEASAPAQGPVLAESQIRRARPGELRRFSTTIAHASGPAVAPAPLPPQQELSAAQAPQEADAPAYPENPTPQAPRPEPSAIRRARPGVLGRLSRTIAVLAGGETPPPASSVSPAPGMDSAIRRVRPGVLGRLSHTIAVLSGDDSPSAPAAPQAPASFVPPAPAPARGESGIRRGRSGLLGRLSRTIAHISGTPPPPPPPETSARHRITEVRIISKPRDTQPLSTEEAAPHGPAPACLDEVVIRPRELAPEIPMAQPEPSEPEAAAPEEPGEPETAGVQEQAPPPRTEGIRIRKRHATPAARDFSTTIAPVKKARKAVEDTQIGSGAAPAAGRDEDSAELPEGYILGGDFKVNRVLGKGGMGVVYEAYQIALQRYVALKVLPENLTANPEYLKRFYTEASAAARLEHPNIVPIYGISSSNGIFYFIMGLVKGRTLEDIIEERARSAVKKRRYIEQGEVLDIIFQVGAALDFAHNNGITHGDIKPANIMIDSAGKAVVTDFGLAIFATAPQEVSHGLFGSPLYMAPEQARGDKIDQRSDIYSTGAVIYEMLTGNCAFDSTSLEAVLRDVVAGAIIPPRRRRPAISPELEAIVLKAMSLDPRDRYQTMRSMLGDLQRYQAGADISVAVGPVVTSKAVRAREETQAVRRHVGWVWTVLMTLGFAGMTVLSLSLFLKKSALQDQMALFRVQTVTQRMELADAYRAIRRYSDARDLLTRLQQEFPGVPPVDQIPDRLRRIHDEEMALRGQAQPDAAAEAATQRRHEELQRVLEKAVQTARQLQDQPGQVYELFTALEARYADTEIAGPLRDRRVLAAGDLLDRAARASQPLRARGRFDLAGEEYRTLARRYPGSDLAFRAQQKLLEIMDEQVTRLQIEAGHPQS